jgi:hypothetical protein
LKRNLTDVLRRGILSTLANWPVILTRIVGTLIAIGLMIVAVIGCIVPPLVSAGIKEWKLPAGDNPSEVMLAFLAEHALLIAYLFAFVVVMTLVMIAIHSAITAGATRIFVDAERAAPDTPELRREQFAAFTMERWAAGARDWWLRIFWIYNGTWGVAGVILLLPLMVMTALEILAIRAQNPAGILGASCGGMALLIVVGIPLALVVSVWTQKAIVVCVTRDTTAREALRSGWRESRSDFLRHFVVFFVIAAVSGGAGAFVSAAFAPFSLPMRGDDFMALFFGPMRLVSLAVQSAEGSAVGLWMIASFAAMTADRR